MADFPMCTADACNQGRSDCPCPESCLRPMTYMGSPVAQSGPVERWWLLNIDEAVAAIAISLLICAAYFVSSN